MKTSTSHLAARAAALLALCAGIHPCAQAQQSTDPSIPVGALNAYPTLVQAGTHPMLTWGIDYPQTILDIVDITPGGTITPKVKVKFGIRLVKSTGKPLTLSNGASDQGSGSAVTVTFSPDGKGISVGSSKDLSNVVLEFSDGTHYKFDGLSGTTGTFAGSGGNAGKIISTVWIKSGSYQSNDGPGYGYRFDSPTAGGELEVEVKADGGGWTTFFHNTQNMVNPIKIEHQQEVRAGKTIDLRSRIKNPDWSPYRSTGSVTPNVLTLVAGNVLPASIPALQREFLQNSLKPYINGAGVVVIGPKDVLVLFELDETNVNASGFDLQDMAVLMTFSNEFKSSKVHANVPVNAPFASPETDPGLIDDGLGSGSAPTLK